MNPITFRLTVANEQLFVSDFEGNRILIYNIKGELLQIISSEALNKPIDIEVIGDIMWVVNHGDGALLQYKIMP